MLDTVNPIQPDPPLCHQRSLTGQGFLSGALRAALTGAPAGDDGGTVFRRFTMSAFLAAAFVFGMQSPSLAYEIRDLHPGLYVAKGATCDHLGSAAEMSFDGRNFAGHYQVCSTKDLGGGKIRNTCIEHQGPNWPTPAQVEADSDKESFDLSVKVISPTEFSYDRETYKFCTKG